MQLRKLALAAVAAAALIPAVASAQGYGYGYGGGGSPPARQTSVQRYGYGDPLQMREGRLRDWMRRGSEEGWLRGWRAQRAWGEFRTIHDQSAYDRQDAWRRLDRLSDFVRWAHDNANG